MKSHLQLLNSTIEVAMRNYYLAVKIVAPSLLEVSPGHAWVELRDDTGKVYSYGMYPRIMFLPGFSEGVVETRP